MEPNHLSTSPHQEGHLTLNDDTNHIAMSFCTTCRSIRQITNDICTQCQQSQYSSHNTTYPSAQTGGYTHTPSPSISIASKKRKMEFETNSEEKWKNGNKRMKYDTSNDPIDLTGDQDMIDLTDDTPNVSTRGERCNPIYLFESDDDVYPDFDDPDDDISEINGSSTSLSINSGFGRMEIKSEDGLKDGLKDELKLNLSTLTLNGLKDAKIKLNRKTLEIIKAIQSFDNIISNNCSYMDRIYAISVALLEIISKEKLNSTPSILVVASKRHTALEYKQLFTDITKIFKTEVLIGGLESYMDSFRKLQTLNILTGTPGRIAHMCRDGRLSDLMSTVICVAMDSSDEIRKSKDMCKDMKRIIKGFPDKKIRVLLMNGSSEQRPCAERYMRDEIGARGRISMFDGMLHENIHRLVDHYEAYSLLPKIDTLNKILEENNKESILIFFSTVATMRAVSKIFGIDCMYSGLNMDKRTKVLRKFEKTHILFSTDLMSDYNKVQVNIIVNYDLKDDVTTYLKRSQSSTTVITITSDADYQKLQKISATLRLKVRDYRRFSRKRREKRRNRKQSILDDRY